MNDSEIQEIALPSPVAWCLDDNRSDTQNDATWPADPADEKICAMPGDLYYGDNLFVLRKWIDDGSIDLVYLDPPFNSQRSYNQIFKGSAAQERVFKDYWEWDDAADAAYREVVGASSKAPRALIALLEALHRTLAHEKDTLAYLSMMTCRLLEMHRVLRQTGVLFLHCDPTASHYLKLVLDAIFGGQCFQNEIIWQRTPSKALTTRRLPNNHDVILYYSKGDQGTWNDDATFVPYDADDLDEKTDEKYAQRDASGRRYQLTSLINPNPNRPNLTYEFLGVTRVWRWTRERMQAAFDQGLVVQPRPGSVPRFKRYLDQQKGKPLGDVWTDIPPLNSQAKERLGFPTQKPVALLERIISAVTNPGDVVLDPFCGCGTTIEACERLRRAWIGIDVAPRAVDIIRDRLARIGVSPNVLGWPMDIDGAKRLAHDDKIGFQRWAVFMAGGRMPDGRKYKGGADGGIDGEILFEDGGRTWRAVVSVKGGGVKADDVRVLRNVVIDNRADMGVLLSMEEPTKGMRDVARDGGFVTASNGMEFRKIQLLTAAQLLRRELPELPGRNVTPESARPGPKKGQTLPLPFGRVPTTARGPVKSRPPSAPSRGAVAHGRGRRQP